MNKQKITVIISVLVIIVLGAVYIKSQKSGSLLDEEQSINGVQAGAHITDSASSNTETFDVAEEVKMKRVDLGDLDGNGTAEYCESYYFPYKEGQEFDGKLKLFWNSECIYEYDGIKQMEPVCAEYLDLDVDGEKELFFKFNSHVNDMPLDEYIVLKKTADKWEPLEMIHGESMLDNEFPIHMTAEADYGVEIGCEGIKKTIHINLEPYFKEYETDLSEYMQREKEAFTEGESYGGVMAWGIWNIESGEYKYQPCLIASHSLCGNVGELMTLGKLDVYFDYDQAGKVKILDLAYEPYIDVEAIEEENSTELTKDEIAWFQDIFFAGNEWCIADQFVTSEYFGADNIDLNQLIYMGMGKGIARVSDAEKQHFKETQEEQFYMLDVRKTTAEGLEDTLMKYAGITLEETNGIGSEYIYYWAETNAYYVSGGDVNFSEDFVIESGKRLEDGRVKLTYTSGYKNGEVILKPNGDDYFFVSNQYK